MLVGGRLVPVGEVIRGYYPAAVTEDEWLAARAATRTRHRGNGKPSVRAVNLFTSLVYMGGAPVVFRSKNGVKYYTPADGSHPGVKLEHVERCLLYWLGEVRLSLDKDTGVDALRARETELVESIRKLKAKIKANPALVDMTETVVEWEGELASVRVKLEAASVPLQSSFLRSQSLIDRLRDCEEEERVALRRELRQVIRFVVGRIDIEVSGAKFRAKTVDVAVTMRDGTERSVYYRTDGTRITECGVTYGGKGRTNFSNLKMEHESGTTPFQVDPAPFRRRGKFADRGPGIVATVAEMKERVRELNAKKMSAPAIGAKLGISRWTVYKYLKK